MAPKHAALAWVVDDFLYLELPGPMGIKSHTLRVPATANGFERALAMLRQRTFDSKLGTAGDPTQHQIDKAETVSNYHNVPIKQVGAISPSMRSTAREVLRKLGMI